MTPTPAVNQEMKDQIIERARQIFAKSGFKKTTMNEIARSLFKTKGSIYYYYKSKEDIFEAIVEKEWRILQAELMKAMAGERDPQRKLRAYVVTRAAFMEKLSNFYAALRDAYLDHYTFVEKLRAKEIAAEKAMIEAILREGAAQGLLRIHDAPLAALAIFTALKGFEFSWATERQLSEVERDTDLLLDMLFNGLRKNDPLPAIPAAAF